MPKKGENSKSVEAKERKAATKKAHTEKLQKEKEDALWVDDDKHLQKKKKQKEDEEKKRAELLKKKAENKALLEKELAEIPTTAKLPLSKITRNQVEEAMEKRNKVIQAINTPKQESRISNHDPLEENLNRVMAGVDVATNVDQAIAALNVSNLEEDKHPEKRMKAAFKAFEAENMNRIKLENPTLRLSQWKQLLQKEWTKSPQNPLNERS